MHRIGTVGLFVAASILGAACPLRAASTAPDYARLRAERARELTTPFGWFSLVALQWLKPGLTTVGSAPGNTVVLADAPAHLLTLAQRDGKVEIDAASPLLTYRNQPVRLGGTPPVVSEDEENAAALASGPVRMWAIERGGKRYLRVKDENAPALKHFHGLRWYAPNPRYRIEAKWIPYTTPHTMRFMNQIGQQSAEAEPGYVQFTVDGKQVTLTPLTAQDSGLWFVFRDTTSPRETDGGGRFLVTDGPSNGVSKPGTVVLDFNEAVNPPCAYSPYATCPLAAPENRLPVAVPAGEKIYGK